MANGPSAPSPPSHRYSSGANSPAPTLSSSVETDEDDIIPMKRQMTIDTALPGEPPLKKHASMGTVGSFQAPQRASSIQTPTVTMESWIQDDISYLGTLGKTHGVDSSSVLKYVLHTVELLLNRYSLIEFGEEFYNSWRYPGNPLPALVQKICKLNTFGCTREEQRLAAVEYFKKLKDVYMAAGAGTSAAPPVPKLQSPKNDIPKPVAKTIAQPIQVDTDSDSDDTLPVPERESRLALYRLQCNVLKPAREMRL
jgi:hypothetical protein